MSIKHILADGRQLDTLEGYTLPYNGTTEAAYRLLAEFLKGGAGIGTGKETQRGLEADRGHAAAQAAAAY